ncbi:MAG: M28 family peptidase [Rhodobacter sp.]|nr:M28 family peptidase [Paracoccaceae bacterium]MCC0077338.1 M28 family peptidase [Rhodobacter sp.]
MAQETAMTAATRVDQGRLMAHLRALAGWVKLSGSAEERESLRHVEAAFREIGFATRIEAEHGFISLPGEAWLIAGNQRIPAITHSHAPSTPAGGLTATVADPGRGAAGDLTGRIVLVDSIATPAAADRYGRAGAAGVIHVSPHEHLHQMDISPVWGSPDSRSLDRLPRAATITISDADGARLREMLAAGLTEVTLHATVETGWRDIPTLIAEARAPARPGFSPDHYVMVTGHHDTWFEGVMDNGTAQAGMLELARVLLAGRDQWKRGLRFYVWSGHSHGRYAGSASYVDRNWHELETNCIANLNIDSIGAQGASVLANVASPAELQGVAARAVRAVTGQELIGARQQRNCDMSFWGVGIPSMFGLVSELPAEDPPWGPPCGYWWHTEHDTLDKIDPALLARDTQICQHALEELLHADLPPLRFDALMAELRARLAGIARALPAALDLRPALALAETVETGVARLFEADKAEGLDTVLLPLARILVPLSYTYGDRFTPDPALPLPYWPLLQALTVVASDPGAAQPVRIAARRDLNRLEDALRRCVAILTA